MLGIFFFQTDARYFSACDGVRNWAILGDIGRCWAILGDVMRYIFAITSRDIDEYRLLTQISRDLYAPPSYCDWEFSRRRKFKCIVIKWTTNNNNNKTIIQNKIVYAVRVGPPLVTKTPIRETNTYTSLCSQNKSSTLTSVLNGHPPFPFFGFWIPIFQTSRVIF